MTKRKTKPKKRKPVYKVYVTYFPDNTYYIGFSTKVGKPYEKYFGSNKDILQLVKDNPETHGLVKDTIFESSKKAEARMQEFLLQWENRHDPFCLNDMINIRLRMSYLKGFQPIDWKPRVISQLSLQLDEKLS